METFASRANMEFIWCKYSDWEFGNKKWGYTKKWYFLSLSCIICLMEAMTKKRSVISNVSIFLAALDSSSLRIAYNGLAAVFPLLGQYLPFFR